MMRSTRRQATRHLRLRTITSLRIPTRSLLARTYSSASSEHLPHAPPPWGRDDEPMIPGYLELENGEIFHGWSFGAQHSVSAEVVFNTGMVGYPENLTDPSYRGQMICCTFPSIGNYGVPPQNHSKDGNKVLKNFESSHIHAEALLVSQYSQHYSHWNANTSLGAWLVEENVPALTGIDTRALVKTVREHGALLGRVVVDGMAKARMLPPEDNRHLVAEVSTKHHKVFRPLPEVDKGLRIICVDLGIKLNTIRLFLDRGIEVTLVPWDYNFLQDLALPRILGKGFDGLFISNGPGDPAHLNITVEYVRKAMMIGKPMFGICMGNHVMGIAAGGTTYKMPFGNRGQNQPCVDLTSPFKSTVITSQNHSYALDTSQICQSNGWKPMFYNANDKTNEGIFCIDRPYFSTQFHPEANSGPEDTQYLFDRFVESMLLRRPPLSIDTRLGITDEENSNIKAMHGALQAWEDRNNALSRQDVQAAADEKQLQGVKKVLVLGGGGLQIGQAGEFDYSGSQAIKTLKGLGIETVLINPNVATVQTAKGLADAVYSLPVTAEFVAKVIDEVKPQGLMLGFGGQTALNCGVELEQAGLLEKEGVKVLGTSVTSIVATEDRAIFKQNMEKIGVQCIPSVATTSEEQAVQAAEKIGYPVILRSAFSLGGLGSGFADNEKELRAIAERAFSMVPQVLVEKSIKGWREVEYEVVRDRFDNAVTVCNMENFDPMGVHTGESIVIAPSQTLTNTEYHKLRTLSLAIVRQLQIIGECNVQLALDRYSDDYYVIEVNPRLSRSSALASKATGYPLAKVAALINMGMALPDIPNSVTQVTSACFEPSLDYLVVKMPRWDMDKFPHVERKLGSAMKSVGEVMAIGRSFEESLQKACRMVDDVFIGFECPGLIAQRLDTKELLEEELANPTPLRLFAIALAFDNGYTVSEIHHITGIDRWWLDSLWDIHTLKLELRELGSLESTPKPILLQAKKSGFSDEQLALHLNSCEEKVRSWRINQGVTPWVKQIDTLAAEFPAVTNYLYLTYHGQEHDLQPETDDPIMVLGSGVYRIGSSVEFDHGAVTAVRTLRDKGRKSIMINYNPETVSTDYDESDRLYFEELTQERIRDIHDFESHCSGVVVSLGGQIPQSLAVPLQDAGLPVLGTDPRSIDSCENREKFGRLMDELGIKQPEWLALDTVDEAQNFAQEVGFPVLVRPSYVLSGAAMKVAATPGELTNYLEKAVEVSPKFPVVITKFYEGAEELEFDAVAFRGQIVAWAVSEHLEEAGVHSGDASLICPPRQESVSVELQAKLYETSQRIAEKLAISGPFSVQYLFKEGELSVIECNLRSSRSFPFVSRALDVDLFKLAVESVLAKDSELSEVPELLRAHAHCQAATQPGFLKHFAAKAPQFSFARLPGADPVVGVEMASTGEVACYDSNPKLAYLQAALAAGFKRPQKAVLVSGNVEKSFGSTMLALQALGLQVTMTDEVADALEEFSLEPEVARVTHDEAITSFKQGSFDLAFGIYNSVSGARRMNEGLAERQRILRRAAVDFNIPIITNLRLANFTVECLREEQTLNQIGYKVASPARNYEQFISGQSSPKSKTAVKLNISGRHRRGRQQA